MKIWNNKIETKYTSEIEGNNLIENNNGQLLEDYVVEQENHCSYLKFTPYLLDDGRVIEIMNPFQEAAIYSNLSGFISKYLFGEFYKLKKLIPKEFPIARIEYLPSNQKLHYQIIDKSWGTIIQKNFDPFLPDGYESFRDKRKLYSCFYNEVLEYKPSSNPTYDRYTLYPSKKTYSLKLEKEKLTSNIPKTIFTEFTMCGRNPYGEKFTDHVEDLVQQLFKLLYIGDSQKLLRYNWESTTLLDKLFYKNIVTDRLADDFFLPLLAYLGNVCINMNGGEWSIRYDQVFDTWVPDIKRGEKHLRIFDPLLKILDSTNPQWDTLRRVAMCK